MSISTFKRRVQKVRKLGLGNILMCFVTRWQFQRLHRKFKFDPWHCGGTWHCRPYQRIAVGLVNKVRPRTVIEVGRGLGEIISRVDAHHRVGYDLEHAVIDAARYIRGTNVNFQVGTGADVKDAQIDVLIALNWIHNLSPMDLGEFLEPFYGRVTYLLLEGITPGESGYRFYHDFSFLNERAELIESADGGVGERRTLMLFKVLT